VEGIESDMRGNSSSDQPNPKPETLHPTDTFIDFARRIIAVPHSELKAKLDAETEVKRALKPSVSHVPVVSSKVR
jgi:hypothetical protein